MEFSFDTVIDRRGTSSVKWNVAENELPMWVADMDFPTAPPIREALRARLEHGVFGYSTIPDAWRQAICGWWARRYRTHLEPDWLLFCSGVVPAISSVIRKLTTPGENVLLLAPVYHVFYHCIEENGRRVRECALCYENGAYRIDFAALEAGLADPQTTLMLFCNPHNPIGKVWERETVEKIAALCKKHHVLLLSDEIHCDLTDPGVTYTPAASLPADDLGNLIVCMAPTKTFNLAGIQTSEVCVPDETLRHKVAAALHTDGVSAPNAFSVPAAVAAYTEGDAWLDALRVYLYENKQAVIDYAARTIPEIRVVPAQATYLLWLDCTALTRDSRQLAADIRRLTGLFLSDGAAYGTGGECFLRMNIACPRAVLMDGLSRLAAAVRRLHHGETLTEL